MEDYQEARARRGGAKSERGGLTGQMFLLRETRSVGEVGTDDMVRFGVLGIIKYCIGLEGY